MFLLDSCVCIDFLRGNLKKGYDLMCKSDPRLFKIPSVVQAELLLGAAKEQIILIQIVSSWSNSISSFCILPFVLAVQENTHPSAPIWKRREKDWTQWFDDCFNCCVFTMRYLLPITCANLKGFRDWTWRLGRGCFLITIMKLELILQSDLYRYIPA